MDFASQEYPGREIIPEMVLAFRRSLCDLAPNRVAQYVKHARSAFGFMLDTGLVQGENPVKPIFAELDWKGGKAPVRHGKGDKSLA